MYHMYEMAVKHKLCGILISNNFTYVMYDYKCICSHLVCGVCFHVCEIVFICIIHMQRTQ